MRTDLSPLLTVEEAAARLSMSAKQLRGHIRAGNISFIDVGLQSRPSYRFRASDIIAFETSRATSCGIKCAESTAAKAMTNGRMTSSFSVIDFAAQRTAKKKRKAEVWITKFRAEKRAAIEQLSGNEPMTFGAASTRWWNERGQHRKDSGSLEGYLALLQSRIGMKTMIATIDDNTVSKLVALRRADGVSPSTVNRSMTEPLRAIMTRARLWKQPVQVIDWSAHKLKEPEGIVREASMSEEAKAFAALRPDLHAVTRFLLVTGWRRAEVCRLKWPDINFETGFATVVGKGDIVHRRPLPAAAIAILRGEEGRHSEFVFTYLVKHPNGGDRGSRRPILPGTLSTAWCRMRDAAGLTGLRLHDLRHTTATRVLRKTGNLVAVQKALGHSRISTTQRYAHMLAEDVRAALDAAAPVAAPVVARSPEKASKAGDK